MLCACVACFVFLVVVFFCVFFMLVMLFCILCAFVFPTPEPASRGNRTRFGQDENAAAVLAGSALTNARGVAHLQSPLPPEYPHGEGVLSFELCLILIRLFRCLILLCRCSCFTQTAARTRVITRAA